MRVLGLPGVTELGNCLLFAVRNEHGVVPEAPGAAWRARDPALETPGAAHLTSVRRKRDELRDVARTPVAHTVELVEQLRDRRRTFGCVARRVETRPPVERLDLDPGILADRPAVAIGVRTTEARLPERVLVVGLPRLGGPTVDLQRIDRPARQEQLELARLVAVARCEDRATGAGQRSPPPAARRSPRSRPRPARAARRALRG